MKPTFTILLVLSLTSQAATYYVDFSAGSDDNNGTSTETPWQHCPGDASATGNPASTTLVSGDTVNFKGGVTYVGGLVISASGSSGSPITFDGNHAGDWGTGRAVIDRNYVANSSCIAASASVSHITIQGFELRNAGGWADDHADVIAAANGTKTNTANTGGVGANFSTVATHTNLVFNNLYIHRIGGWRNTQGWTESTIAGGGIALKNCNGVTITNCELTKMKAGIGIYAQSGVAQNITVVDCNIHNYITWGVDVAPQASGDTLKDITIRDTRIHDYAEFCQGNWQGDGEWPHTDGIFLRTAAIPSVWTNVRVFNNHFYCDSNPGNGGTASIYVSQGASALIYNNVFNEDSQTRAIGVEHSNPDASEQVVRIYNNTFISGSPAISVADETDPARRRVFVANNLFRQPSGTDANNTIVNNLSGVGPEEMDNNLYWSPGWTSANKYTHNAGGYLFFTDVFGSTGWEEHSTYADPLFVDFAATPSARDLRLQSGSPAIGAGTNLSAFFTTDKNGVARGSVFDIGALEYQAEPQPTTLNVNALTVQGQAVFGP